MDITSMTLWWAPERDHWTGWAGFTLKGDLYLPDGIEKEVEPEATVVFEIPTQSGPGLTGEQTIEFKVLGSSGRWYYMAWPGLPYFRYEP
jgi:hypothetical protein